MNTGNELVLYIKRERERESGEGRECIKETETQIF